MIGELKSSLLVNEKVHKLHYLRMQYSYLIDSNRKVHQIL